MWRGDRGGSAIEAALLMAAVALVMVPALFFLGGVVGEAFSKPCDELSGTACPSSTGTNGGDRKGNVGTDVSDERPPDDLDDQVADQLSGEGAESAVCNGSVTVSPPTRSTSCEVSYDDARPPRSYLVEWTDGSDDLTLTPL